ncbi:hypothetical protein [Microcoleus sp. F4-D5]
MLTAKIVETEVTPEDGISQQKCLPLQYRLADHKQSTPVRQQLSVMREI